MSFSQHSCRWLTGSKFGKLTLTWGTIYLRKVYMFRFKSCVSHIYISWANKKFAAVRDRFESTTERSCNFTLFYYFQTLGRDHRPSTEQGTLEGISITDRESCRMITDRELGGNTSISQFKIESKMVATVYSF